MKRKVKIILVSIVVVVLAVIYSFIDKATPLYDTEWDTSEYENIELYEGDSVTQEFICEENYLDGVSIKIAAIGDSDQILLSYQLCEEETGNILITGETDLESLESGKFFKISFDRINNLQDKKLMFTLSVSKGNEANGINVYTTDAVDGNNFSIINSKNLNDTLVIRTLSHQFGFETFFVVICFVLYIVFFMKWMYKLFR